MTLLMDPSTSSGSDKGRSGSDGRASENMNDTEELTELGAALRIALDGKLADERAEARATFPTEHLHRDPGQSVERMDVARHNALRGARGGSRALFASRRG